MRTFSPNDTALIGCYYIADTNDYSDVIVGPEPNVPGMRGALVAGVADPIIEPIILKVHAPPFRQDVQDGDDPETGIMQFREVELVFATDRTGNLYLVHWNSEGCFQDYFQAQRHREEHFDRLKRKQLLNYGGENSPAGHAYLRNLILHEDKKNAAIETLRKKKLNQTPVNIPEVQRQIKVLEDVATSIAGIPSYKSKFSPGK